MLFSALDGAIRWANDWGGKLGDPIVADLDGDGDVEILITSPDGYLNALGKDVLGAPAWVRENHGDGPATSAAEDVDEQEAGDRLHLNWAHLAGAQGYAVQVADQDGAAILPMKHVGTGTSVTLTDLNLHLGRTYYSTVRAWADGPAGQQYSVPTLSDGVTIVDLSPPIIAELVADPPVLLAGASSVIRATLSDATRLAALQIDVTAADGSVVAHWQRPLAVGQHKLRWSWASRATDGGPLAPGSYRVKLTARDGAGHFAVLAVDVLLCATLAQGACGDDLDAGAIVDAGGGSAGDGISGPDSTSAGEVEAGNDGDPGGCCNASPNPAGRGGVLLLLLGMAGLLFLRRLAGPATAL